MNNKISPKYQMSIIQNINDQLFELYKSYEDVENAFFKQFKNLCYHSVVLTTTAQRIHKEKDGSDLL